VGYSRHVLCVYTDTYALKHQSRRLNADYLSYLMLLELFELFETVFGVEIKYRDSG
jgi:hypothetical protein